jgi:hypothetical protein
MKLQKNDLVTFKQANSKLTKGSAIRFDPRTAEIVVRVFGDPFHWEGGPPGEYLDSKDSLVQGQIGHSDSLWAVPMASVVNVESAKSLSFITAKGQAEPKKGNAA